MCFDGYGKCGLVLQLQSDHKTVNRVISGAGTRHNIVPSADGELSLLSIVLCLLSVRAVTHFLLRLTL